MTRHNNPLGCAPGGFSVSVWSFPVITALPTPCEPGAAAATPGGERMWPRAGPSQLALISTEKLAKDFGRDYAEANTMASSQRKREEDDAVSRTASDANFDVPWLVVSRRSGGPSCRS